jgi:hypothetical protein
VLLVTDDEDDDDPIARAKLAREKAELDLIVGGNAVRLRRSQPCWFLSRLSSCVLCVISYV